MFMGEAQSDQIDKCLIVTIRVIWNAIGRRIGAALYSNDLYVGRFSNQRLVKFISMSANVNITLSIVVLISVVRQEHYHINSN